VTPILELVEDRAAGGPRLRGFAAGPPFQWEANLATQLDHPGDVDDCGPLGDLERMLQFVAN
jgi:hypothetical protein